MTKGCELCEVVSGALRCTNRCVQKAIEEENRQAAGLSPEELAALLKEEPWDGKTNRRSEERRRDARRQA